MHAVNDDFILFWVTPWSKPFRAACLWFTPDTQPLQGHKPNTRAPRWVRPFFVQQWVGEAIAARLAANPQTTAYRYGRDSEPCWEEDGWASSERGVLRQLSEALLLWSVGREVECLLRIAQEHPSLVGQMGWTGAALNAAEHLARLYRELKRRLGVEQARALLREELRRFVAGQQSDSEAQ